MIYFVFFVFVVLLCFILVSSRKEKKKSKVEKAVTRSPISENRRDVDTSRDFLRQHYEEHLQDAIEAGNEKEIKYYSAKLDPEFQIAENQYWSHDLRIMEMKVDKTTGKDEFEKACQDQMLRAYAFKPLYEKYYSQPLNANVFKTYALFLEREGRFVDAATVCSKALRWGFPNDKTQGGMAGRLVRMVKKSGGETNAEVEDALKKYCQ